MVEIDARQGGSTEEFEEDWLSVLEHDRPEYLIAPTPDSGRQADLLEWIKVRQIETLLNQADINRGSILEYGCGAAGISLYLSECGYETHICDLSANALKVAEINKNYNFESAELASSISANVFHLPYASNSFDVVMSYGLLEHFSAEALSDSLVETIRVLRPGGIFIADIVPGPERWNVRTIGLMANWAASSALSLVKGEIQDLNRRYHSYFEYYFETAFDDQTWAAILAQHPLENVRVAVCRPFPVLAIEGDLEKLYTKLILRLIKYHEAFDGANNWFTRRWGWMYLASGRKRM